MEAIWPQKTLVTRVLFTRIGQVLKWARNIVLLATVTLIIAGFVTSPPLQGQLFLIAGIVGMPATTVLILLEAIYSLVTARRRAQEEVEADSRVRL